MTKATVIADSKNEFGQRIVTLVVTFPRYLLAEFNTHRMLSRNSASSRAIRFEKMVQSIQDTPFVPSRWQKDHPGMQGTEYFTNDEILHIPHTRLRQVEDLPAVDGLQKLWLRVRDNIVSEAKNLSHLRVTKQIINRLLEPFMYHTCLVTATEWENFFALRAHEAAEINFQALAELMLEAINASEPVQLKGGEWHIPFGDKFNDAELAEYTRYAPVSSNIPEFLKEHDELRVKLATVRCARISYNTQDNDSTIAKDLELHDRLALSGHWSAFEHCAQAMSQKDFESWGNFTGWDYKYHENHNLGWCGNFQGFIQYRKMFPNENRQDSRLIKK